MNTNSQPDFSQLAQPFINYSRHYFEKIKSSLITIDDLRNLYKILSTKSTEAAFLKLSNLIIPLTVAIYIYIFIVFLYAFSADSYEREQRLL